MRFAKWTVIIIALGLFCTYLYNNYGIINTEHMTDVQIEKKVHEGKNYYIYVEDEKLKVKDKNTWMLLTSEKQYDLTYEWYGTITPYIKQINQTGDHDTVGGGH
ncbi:hypothetical protein [Thalassobacillus pellis]|uniref:hypothetical protein n=1 Tax=Thalassobacillus pellis TaxID=748008 RepID=UPI001961D0B9|nr:hypothetical protein [Thalassobacillus pellis]MBM7551793.1 hypothetical protein [Thalassobacillus pellis]